MASNGMVGIRVGRGLQVEPIGGLRNELGQYTSAGVNAQLDANRNIAHDIQAKVVQRMRNHIEFGRRAGASTGRLIRATAEPDNIIVSKEFVGVGNPTWLDRSQAKYWRTFEEGSAAVWSHPFVGTTLFGMAGAKVPSAHGQSPGLRTVHDDYELPTRNGRSLGKLFVVQHEIAPANIYAEVAQEYRGQIPPLSIQFARRVLGNALRETVIRDKG